MRAGDEEWTNKALVGELLELLRRVLTGGRICDEGAGASLAVSKPGEGGSKDGRRGSTDLGRASW